MKQETKQITTLSEAAVDYISAKSERAREYGLCYQAFKAGAEFQKEQDKTIIEQLLLSNKLLCDILEVERTQNGISLNIRYGTEYELSKKIYEKALNHIKTN